MDLVVGGLPSLVWENYFPIGRFNKMDNYNIATLNEPRTINFSDFDSDGDEDIYVGVFHSYQSGINTSRFFQNDRGSASNWLKVKLQGSLSNRDGIGATVKVFTDPSLVQTRQLIGTVGGNSHVSRSLNFGLGGSAVAKKVRVEWPSGRITAIPLVESCDTVVINEENAAPQGGSIYLTINPTGVRQEPSVPLQVGDEFDFYLSADVSSCMEPGFLFGGFETSVRIPENVSILQKEILIPGIDEDPNQNYYSMRFAQGIDGGQGPVPLVRFRGVVSGEGSDPVIYLGNIFNSSFQDPIEPPVQCWWEWNSDVLFRFSTPSVEDSALSYLLDDTKAPQLNHSGLWQDYRRLVIVNFDEPVGELAEDVSHYSIFSVLNPAIGCVVSNAFFVDPSTVHLFLAEEIPILKDYDIEITGMEDLHGNVAGTLTGHVTQEDPTPPDVKITESLNGPPGGKSDSVGELYWIELLNDGVNSLCMNGWSINSGQGNLITVPESPVVILPAGGYVVFDSSGQLVDLSDQGLNIVAMEELLSISGSQISVEDPFGVETDAVDVSVVLKSAPDGYCSVQKFVSPEDHSITWVEDAPEYIEGYRGTPGKENILADGSPMFDDLPPIGNSRLLYSAPNPFNPETTIYLALATSGRVNVSIFDVRGRKVRTLLNEDREKTAMLELTWKGMSDEGERVSSGVYFVRLKASDGVSDVLKVSLVK